MLDYPSWFWPIALKISIKKEKKKPSSRSPIDNKSSIKYNLLFLKKRKIYGKPSLPAWPWAIISPFCLRSCQLYFFHSQQALGCKLNWFRGAFHHVWIYPSFQKIFQPLCVEMASHLLGGQSIWGCLGLLWEPLCSEPGLCVCWGKGSDPGHRFHIGFKFLSFSEKWGFVCKQSVPCSSKDCCFRRLLSAQGETCSADLASVCVHVCVCMCVVLSHHMCVSSPPWCAGCLCFLPSGALLSWWLHGPAAIWCFTERRADFEWAS